MPRIGIDARLTYYRHGGIAQYTYNLIEQFATLDTENSYHILHQRKDQRNLAKSPNQKRITTYTPSHFRFERLTLALELLPLKLNLLHSPDFIPPYGGGHKSVITIHDLTFLHYPQFLTPDARRYYNNQIQSAVDRADHIMTDSESSRQDVLNMLNNVPPEKVTTVLLGLSDHFKPASDEEVTAFRQKYALEAGYILFVGTYEPRKNLKGLLHAYSDLRDQMPDISRLVIAGQRGWLYDDIFALSKTLDLEKRIVWLEKLPYEDLPALYTTAGILCLPSFYEGFGFPALEAMGCGTPVIVSNRSSLPEIVGEDALLINPDDISTITAALSRLLNDTQYAKNLARRGKLRASNFTWQETARQVLSIYEKVLDS